MADNIFYCEVGVDQENSHWEFPPGIYVIPDRSGYRTKISRCMSYSKRVWIQGPKGGIRLKDEYNIFRYVTRDEELMKEFMWVKLKAQPLKHYD